MNIDYNTIRDKKYKTVKTVGIILIGISVFMIFSNLVGAIFSKMLGGTFLSPPANYVFESPQEKLSAILFNHYFEFCLFFILFGIVLLIGAIHILKLKKWAYKFLKMVSIAFAISIWTFIIILTRLVIEYEGAIFFLFVLFFLGIFSSVLSITLFWFLNKKEVRESFI